MNENGEADGPTEMPAAWRGGPAIPRPRSARRRRGLVLGGGGVLGFAWMAAALHALEEQEGFDAREVDIVVGTSAGSILAALVGLGAGVDAVLRHQRGTPLPADLAIDWDYDGGAGGALPPRPGFGLGSRGLLLEVARHPRRLPPLAAMSAVFPRGRGTLHPVGRMIDGAVTIAARGADGPAPHWPAAPQTWIVAMDYGRGQRVAFGRPDAPPARLSEAVMASCAIPGWYAPVRIAGRPYVDGGTFSPTSLDLLADEKLDEVWVLAPMVSFAVDRPRSTAARLERRFRRLATRRALREATQLQAAGTAVTIIGPGPEDLEAMGANLMDPSRRIDVLVTSLRTSAEALRRSTGPAAATAGGLGAS
ncbi:MAG TPA: patatin-like phospholipase family protein [Mycobacteriales bacterium]|nr:patatin-like phospholipase family protein [Mycobacteriales bacterium]